ncbi:MAG: NAD(+) synthase [Caldisericia bacterium]|jgi:NAD+ synthase|nr:NAD(+) synthase [Caldisericia bacterium]
MKLDLLPQELSFDPQFELTRIKNFINSFLKKVNKERVVLGLSGGIDSAIVLKLLTLSIPKENIFALILPEKDTDKKNVIHAISLAKDLGVKYKIINITKILSKFGIYISVPYFILPTRKLRENYTKKLYEKYKENYGKSPFYLQYDIPNELKGDTWFFKGISYLRIKHRIRMVTLYYYADLLNGVVAGTTNKTEEFLGFFVKYGDYASDFEPIIHLFKSQIFKFGEYLNLPEVFLKKKPSPDLLPGIEDEFSIGLNYLEIDRIIVRFIKNVPFEKISEELNIPLDSIINLYKTHINTEFLRNPPPNVLNFNL